MKSFIVLCLIILSPCVVAKKFTTEQWSTSQGTKVIFYQALEVPMLDISLAFAAGSAYDNQQFGLSALTNTLLNQGTDKLSADAIAESFADTGAQFEANSSREMAVLHLKTLTESKALAKSIDTFTEIITRPSFPQDAFQHEKNQQLIAIKQSEESPENIANLVFFKNLYPNHPYGHPINGTKATVQALTSQQVKEFYKQYYTANNSTLILVGAIDAQTARSISEKITHDLPKGRAASKIPLAKPLLAAKDIHIDFPSSQTLIRIGQLGIEHHSQNYFPLMVGNYILGGGALVSRLALEVRGKRGLTYGVVSQFIPMSGEGPFVINLATKNNQAKNALLLTNDIVKTFIEKGPTAEELIAAKQYLVGNFSLSLASNRSIANTLLKMAFFHLPENYLDNYVAAIQAVSLEDIKTAFKKEINPNKLLTITVGKT